MAEFYSVDRLPNTLLIKGYSPNNRGERLPPDYLPPIDAGAINMVAASTSSLPWEDGLSRGSLSTAPMQAYGHHFVTHQHLYQSAKVREILYGG